jgi:hypothetical protein
MRPARLLVALISLSFALVGGSPTDRFQSADMTEQEARTFLESLQGRLRAGDFEKVADLIEFPLTLRPEYSLTREGFLSAPRGVFTDRVKQKVLSQKLSDLCVTYEGVLIDGGTVWFSVRCDGDSSPGPTCDGRRIRIVTVNSEPEKKKSDEELRGERILLARIKRDNLFPKIPRRCLFVDAEWGDPDGLGFAVRFDQCKCGADSFSNLIDRFFVTRSGRIEWITVGDGIERRPYEEFLARERAQRSHP